LIGSADLDIDIIIPDDYPIHLPSGQDVPIGKFLVMDQFDEKILFDSNALKAALQTIWAKLDDIKAGNTLVVDAKNKAGTWLKLTRDPAEFTRSIPGW
jgi:hypothetical protein